MLSGLRAYAVFVAEKDVLLDGPQRLFVSQANSYRPQPLWLEGLKSESSKSLPGSLCSRNNPS